MTHPALAASITAELASYREVVKRDWAWPSPAAGFAAWLYARRDLPAPFTPPEAAALADVDERRLGEAPVLAAYGYLLAAAGEPDEGAAATWTSGMARLSSRDPLPGDRASFFFRPVEMLGLALGAAAVTGHDAEPRRWLRQVIKEGGPRLGRDSRSVALAAYAGSALGAPAGAGRVSSPDGSAADLAIRWLEFTEAFDGVFAGNGTEVIRAPVRSPRASSCAERFVGTLRRECLDHVLILGERHLRKVLAEYARHCNGHRRHQGLQQDPRCASLATPWTSPPGSSAGRSSAA